MSKHTPGPWEAAHNGNYWEIVAGREFIGDTCASKHLDSGDNGEANARLIAAAPDLLAALNIAVRQNSHDMQMTGEELRICAAAIAKATGEA